MFAIKANASKVALATLVQRLIELNFSFIDCQITTGHLKSMGAKEVPRTIFLQMLKTALKSNR